MQILLIDDEIELVSTLAERLSLRGYDVDWVTNWEDALKKASEKKYDLAILDVKMPKIGGFQLKKKLQALYPGMKYMYMTGHGSEDDFNKGSSESRVIDYLVKPVKIETLMNKINLAKKD